MRARQSAQPIKELFYNGCNNSTTLSYRCMPRPRSNYSEKILITYTTRLRNKQGKDIRTEKQKEATPKDKESSFKKEEVYNIHLQKMEYKGRVQSS